MMGTKDRPTVSEDNKLTPPEAHGVKLMSMGFLLEEDTAAAPTRLAPRRCMPRRPTGSTYFPTRPPRAGLDG